MEVNTNIYICLFLYLWWEIQCLEYNPLQRCLRYENDYLGIYWIYIYRYLKKFKSVIMMLKLIGIHKNKTLCISLMNAIWQIMIIICMALIIYLIASIPQILQLLNVANITDIIVSLPGFYLAFNALCSFKLLHFVYLFIMIVLAVLVSNIIMFSYYNKQDITKWLRGE